MPLLSLCRNMETRANRAAKFEMERARRNPFQSGTKTSVMNLPVSPPYRFFSSGPAHSLHASPHLSWPVSSRCMGGPRTHDCGSRAIVHRMGRHAGTSAARLAGRMLLRLRAVEDLRRLRKNVRTAEIQIALVGGYLRKTADPIACGESRCWTASAASGQSRTRLFDAINSTSFWTRRGL